MATPDYGPFFPFTDGDTIDSSNVFALFYSVDPQDSLSTINGLLNTGDVDIDFAIDFSYTQPGSAVDCEGSSGTASTDYVHTYVFGGYQVVDDTAFDPDVTKDPVRAIPGGGRSFYMPWQGTVLVMWSVMWTYEHAVEGADDTPSRVFLVVNGDYDRGSMRQQAQTWDSNYVIQSYRRHRVFSGHTMIELGVGWHNLGLFILGDNRGRSTRVHSVSIDLMKFKSNETPEVEG